MSFQISKALDIKQNILETSYRLFKSYGLRSVTMDDIAKELSISKKTIYQSFKDKNEIVSLVSRYHLDKEKEKVNEIMQEGMDGIERLFGITQCLRESVASLNPSLMFDLQKYYPKAFKVFEEYKDKVFLQSLIDTLRQGINEGYFRDNIDAEIISVMRMEQIQLAFNPVIFPRNKYDFKQVQWQLLEHFVKGIVTAEGEKKLAEFSKNAGQANLI